MSKPASDPTAWIAVALVLAVAAAGVWGYLDLRTEVRRLRAMLEEREAREEPAPPPAVDAGIDAATTEEALWECSGEIAADLARIAVGQRGTAVFDCYAQRRAELPGLAGTLVLSLRVGADGRVTHANVGGEIGDEPLRACVGNAALGWRFPPPAGGDCAIVSAPFNLGD